jgi:hypothetical protein
MSKTMFNVISPDGFPITCEPFASEQEALKAIPAWCQRFKKQGYYSTSGRQRIPLKELRDYLSVAPVSETDLYPVCHGNCNHSH